MLFLNIGYCLVNYVRVFNVFFLNVHIRADFLFWWFVRLVLLYVFIFLHRFAFRWNAVWLKVWCSCFCLFFLSSFFSRSLCVFYFVYTGCGIVESVLFLVHSNVPCVLVMGFSVCRFIA